MPPYPRRHARRYPNDISPDDYDLGMNSDIDPLDEVERAEMQNWVRDNILGGRPRTGRISTEEILYAYESDDENDTPYRRRRREEQRRRNRNRSRGRSRGRSKSDQELTEHHHHHHVVIYNPTNNSSNSDSGLYTPRNQQLPQAQTLRPGIAVAPALGARGVAIGGIGAGPRALLQPGLNQCTCCCCVTARSHQGGCSFAGPMTPGLYARQFGQQRLLQ